MAFALYDTYGFPLELTAEIVEERGLAVDREGFNRQMTAQRERARGASKQKRSEMAGDVWSDLSERLGETPFSSGEEGECTSRVTALVMNGEEVSALEEGDEGEVLLDSTPFYAEKGGQVGDRGTLSSLEGKASVLDTVVRGPGACGPPGEGPLGDPLSGGHPPHGGEHGPPEGHSKKSHGHPSSSRGPREDTGGRPLSRGPSWGRGSSASTSHFEPLSEEQILSVEEEVNEKILANIPLEISEGPWRRSPGLRGKALFEEKYGEKVRMVRIPSFSVELCGRLHALSTGEIGLFKILREEGIGSETRRITAVTGRESPEAFSSVSPREWGGWGALLSVEEEAVLPRVERLQEEVKTLARRVDEVRAANLRASLDSAVKKEILSSGLEAVWGRF
ncbi:hypothetical protein MASR2M17_01440 [Aminivibrio sp.]